MVYRGPHEVQLTNGWPKRRSRGSRSSRAQSAQVAVSGETRARRGPEVSLSRTSKPRPPATGRSSALTRSTRASGGGRVRASSSVATAAGGPSTSRTTPSGSLPTQPVSPRAVASRQTKGRNPTPWTTPETRTRRRTSVGPVSTPTGAPPARRTA